MEKSTRRVLGLFLLFIMLFTIIPSPSVFVMAEEDSGGLSETELMLEEQVLEVSEEILSELSQEETDEELELPSETQDDENEEKTQDQNDLEVPIEDEISEEEEIPREGETSISQEDSDKEEVLFQEDISDSTSLETLTFKVEIDGVTVTASTVADVFDEEVRLVVEPIYSDSKAYQDTEDVLKEDGADFDGMIAFDIYFETIADNTRIEPNGFVSIELSLDQKALEEMDASVDLDTVSVSHIKEDNEVELVADATDDTLGTVEVKTAEKQVESLDASFDVDGFSTFAITWKNTQGQDQSATIHYGTLDGDAFIEFSQDKVALLDLTATSISIDNNFDGYSYLTADYQETDNSRKYNLVSPLLTKTNNGWTTKIKRDSPTSNGENVVEEITIANGSNIYVYYTEPVTRPSGSSDDTVHGPTTEKNVQSNNDGTYTITLDVTAPVIKQEEKHGVNVIIALDRTPSMKDSMNGVKHDNDNNYPANDPMRWAVAQEAFVNMVDILIGDGNDIDFSVITFHNQVDRPGNSSEPNYTGRPTYQYYNTWIKYSDWSNDPSIITDLKNYITNIPVTPTQNTYGDDVRTWYYGTNWQDPLRVAYNLLQNRPDSDPTYVIFVTDGEPNVYGINGHENNYIGGSDPTTALNRAITEAVRITALDKVHLYGIYVSSSSGLANLQSLIDRSGGDQTIEGRDRQALNTAFSNVAEIIVNSIGSTNVSVDDGIPSLTSVSAAVSGEASGYKYYKKRSSDTGFAPWNEAPGATYSKDNGVTWDLSAVGQLEEDTTYRITFTVWPSQEAYDLIADLNNGVREYDDLDAKTKTYVKGSKEAGYTLLTNTHLQTRYTYNGSTYVDPFSYEDEAMPLPTPTFNVSKVWHNDLDKREASSVRLIVTKDGDPYLFDVYDETGNVIVAESHAVEVSKDTDPEWTSEDIYISCGNMTVKDGVVTINEPGHDYSIIEPAGYAYYWDLTADIYHPMVINGVATMLVLTDDVAGLTLNTDYYVINGANYKVTDSGENTLTAVNDRRSFLNLVKTVEGEGKEPDALFTFKVKVGKRGDDDIWFSATDPTFVQDENEVYQEMIVSENVQMETRTVSSAVYDPETDTYSYEYGGKSYTLRAADDGTGGLMYTGFYYVPAGEEFTVQIKDTWTVRFINLPTGTEYEIQETTMPDNYVFENASSSTDNGGAVAVIEDTIATGTIDKPNNDFTVEYTNKCEATTAEATKEWANADGSDTAPDRASVVFTVYDADDLDTAIAEITLDGSVDTTGEPTEWEATFVGLPKTKYVNGVATDITYVIKETTPWPGYTPSTEEAVENGGTITNTQISTVVEATKAWLNADGTDAPPTGASVVFELFADGESTEKTVTLDGVVDENGEIVAWKASFTGLAKYQEDGTTEVNYTVKETTTYPGYTSSTTEGVRNGGTITNSQDKLDVIAEKRWVNADGSSTPPTGASITITLLTDGSPSSTVELDGTVDENGEYESWKAIFSDLPKYQLGTTTEIEYTVRETVTYPGYTPSVETGNVIVNTQEKINVSATKAWKNADGTPDAPDGAKVTFTLYAGGVATSYEVELDGSEDTAVPTTTDGYESTAWVATFVNLPRYQTGTTTEIEYTVVETGSWTGYTVSGSPAAIGGTITNSQSETNANARKAWKNADGTTSAPEGASVVYTLYADGEATDHTVTLTGTVGTEPGTTGSYESAEWTAMFVHLPMYKEDGTTRIIYTVKETTGYPGYISDKNDPVSSGELITNTQEAVEVEVEKTWANADGSSIWPAGVTVEIQLTADDEAVTGKTVTLSASQTNYAFTGLPKYQTDGTTEIAYSVKEAEVPGYASTVGDLTEGKITVTNTQETTEVEVEKVWANADGSDTWPTDVTVTIQLIADGEAVTGKTATLNASQTSYTFTGLPKYQEDGTTEIAYSVEEAEVPGYASEVSELSEGKITVTNTQETVEVVVIKVWEDEDNAYSMRPDSITIRLYADGVELADKVATLDGTTDEDGFETEAWKATFSDLPKYQADGETKIVYTVSEDEVKLYVTTITQEETSSEAEIETEVVDTETETADPSDAKDVTEGDATEEETITYTVTNTLINLEITKVVDTLYDAGGTSNSTFVFDVRIKGADGTEKYQNFVGITFDGTAGSSSEMLYALPYQEGDTIIVEEVYTANHKLVSQTDVTWDEEKRCFCVSFTNTFDPVIPSYGKGIVNEYSRHDSGTLTVRQKTQGNQVA